MISDERGLWQACRDQTGSEERDRAGICILGVLGPLLFLIYINDLIDLLPPDSHPTLFADDLKLFSDTSPVFIPGSKSLVASRLLQCSLDQLFLWSTLWQLHVSIPKCSILSISNSKLVRSRHYLIGDHPLPQVTTCSDLGVIMDTHLSLSHHILSTAKKASRQSALILRCFLSRDADNLKLAFCTYVRPTVEYASSIWSPHTQKDTDLLENVQRRFTKSISKLHYLPYTARLSSSGVATGGEWESGPPTSVQTPPEICANPLRSVLYIGGGGGPMHVYCNFLLLTSKKNCSDPPLFLGWRSHCCPVLISQLFLVAVLILIFALSSVSCTTLPIWTLLFILLFVFHLSPVVIHSDYANHLLDLTLVNFLSSPES